MGGAQARALSHQSMQAKEMQAKDTKKYITEFPWISLQNPIRILFLPGIIL